MKFNRSTIFGILSHAILYTVTALLVSFAIFISIIRWYPNLSQVVEQKIETRLAEVLNAEIVIGSLDVSRDKLFSEIVAYNVRIIDRQDPDNVWQVDKAKLAVNLSKSLLTRSLRIKEVILSGMDVSLLRDSAGDLHVNQTFLLPAGNMTGAGNGGAAGQYADVRLALVKSNIHWVDELTQTNYLFEDIDISINPNARGYDVFLSGDLPDVLGKSLRAYVRFEGDIKKLSDASIEFYVSTEQFHLSEVARRFIGDSGDKVPVVIDSEVWGRYSDNTLSALQGSMSAERIVAEPQQINPDLCLSDEYIQQVSMQFEWQNINRDWHFLANNVEVVTSRRDWTRGDIQIKLQRHSLNAKTILAHIGTMNLGAICNTLHTYSPHIVRFEDQLKDYRINGNIEDLFIRFDLSENHQSSFQYSAGFSDASLWMREGDRLISGVGGYVKGGDAGGKVLLDADDVHVKVPDQFPGFTMQFATNGSFHWTHTGHQHEFQTDNLQISNHDLSMDARFYVKLADGDIYTDSQIHLSHANARAVGDYFPLFAKTRTTKKWLTESIHKGDVTNAAVLLRGNLRAFPFHQASGVFQTHVNVENGVLEYKKTWPQLENVQASVTIEKDRINVTSEHATTLNSKVKEVDIQIDSFLRAILTLNGTVDGPAQDMLNFLAEANMVAKTDSIVDQINLDGDSRLEIDFSRSLSRKIDFPPQVSGDIHFLGNTLNIDKAGITLEELAGEVAFDAEGASSDMVIARLFGHPVEIALRPAGEGASQLNFSGLFDLGEYLSQQYPHLQSFISGSTPVEGELFMPSFLRHNNPDKLMLKVNSDLTGIRSKLPRPLEKSPPSAMSAIFNYDQKQGVMSWHLADLIGLHFTLVPRQPLTLRLIDLDARDNPVIPDQGMMIRGSWDELAPDLWLAAHQQFLNAGRHESAAPLPDVQVNIKSLDWPAWPAQNVALVAGEEKNNYVIRLDSSLGKGVIDVPHNSGEAIRLDMESLTLGGAKQPPQASYRRASDDAGKSVHELIDPRQMRAFQFFSDRLILNEIKLSDVLIDASVSDSGILFNDIQISAQDMNSSGTGSWTVQGGQHTTAFDFQLESIDVEDTLTDLGFNSSLKKGEATASGNLAWHAPPYHFSLDKLYGRANFTINDGSVSEIDPGNAGRLLALLNLGAISRRLSLDFKDVTDKGFTFDAINGKLQLDAGGDLKTENVSIKSSAADIEISGKTNLVEQTYDQTIFVTPAVSGALPAVGALVGGPVGAAGGILAEQIAKVVGLNKVSEIEYKMTGTWQSPEIERVNERKINQAAETIGQQSAP